MLRRTSQCLLPRQSLLLRPRYISTSRINRLATPTLSFAPAWGKITETLFEPAAALESTIRNTPVDLLRTCTVLASNPKDTTLQELLDRIPQFSQHQHATNFSDFLLLVTPSYANTLRTQKHVIEQALTRIFPLPTTHAHQKEAVRLVAAVVDRLPRPSALDESTVGDIGAEGIALRLIHDATTISNPHVSKDSRTTLYQNSAPFISFQLDARSTPENMRPTVQLPLANTIFQNGLPSTLIYRKYTVTKDGQSLVQMYEQLCDSHRVHLPRDDGRTDQLALSVPLVPLTSARSVVACMGNIVRRLSANSGLTPEDSAKESILASHELEQSVTDYHKARGLSPRAVSVWALVIPEKTFTGGLAMAAKTLGERDLSALWKSASSHDPDTSRPNILTLLQHGARLHKVLSGGGGWGKKAGLLSLDPDTGYGEQPSAQTYTPGQHSTILSDQGDSSFLLHLDRVFSGEPEDLRKIVNKGDYLQFYISPPASSEKSSSDSHLQSDLFEPSSASPRTAEFGAIPSTVDDMPSVQQGSIKNKRIQVYPNHFGALSETGMAIFFGTSSPNGKGITPAADPATKVDVPFSRIRYQTHVAPSKQTGAGLGFSPTKPMQSMITGHCLRRQNLVDLHDFKPTICSRKWSTCSILFEYPKRSQTTFQRATKNALTPRTLKKIQRVPKHPNKNWKSADIRAARRAIAEVRDKDSSSKLPSNSTSESAGSEPGKLVSESTDGEPSTLAQSPRYPTREWKAADIKKARKALREANVSNHPSSALSTSHHSIEYAEKKAYVALTIKDIVSPAAYQYWESYRIIPKTPNPYWSAKDIRQAHTFFKRQKRLKMWLDGKCQENTNTVTVFKSLNISSSRKPALMETMQEPGKAIQQHPTILALKQQAQARSRARILREAFHNLLRPAKEPLGPSTSSSTSTNTRAQDKRINSPLLTHRIRNLITMHESPTSPRILIYELLDVNRFPHDEEMDTAIEKERRNWKKEQVRREMVAWRTAVEEMKDMVQQDYPEKWEKKEWKVVLNEEMDELRKVEDSVSGFLLGGLESGKDDVYLR